MPIAHAHLRNAYPQMPQMFADFGELLRVEHWSRGYATHLVVGRSAPRDEAVASGKNATVSVIPAKAGISQTGGVGRAKRSPPSRG
jgi:hypothetical protein